MPRNSRPWSVFGGGALCSIAGLSILLFFHLDSHLRSNSNLRPVDPASSSVTEIARIASSSYMPSTISGMGAAAEEDLACVGCHDDAIETFQRTAHVALDSGDAASRQGFDSSCSACHGDAQAHADTLGEAPVFGFDATTAENSARCLTCHADSHPRFPRSEHARADIGCSDCHSSHPDPDALPRPGLATMLNRPSAQCAECHQTAFTDFSFTAHHRLEEGTIECTDCHDPHAPESRAQLPGFKQQTCVACHVDKGGPFVFEHGSQRVDGCTSCHTAHGSPNRHMLHFQQVAEQCYSCHAFVPGFHTRFTVQTQCTNCHVTIHGSNLDPAFLK